MENQPNKIDMYGSHLGLLKIIFNSFNIKTVLEFGMGDHSTAFFLKQDCELFSIEQQEKAWFDKCNKNFGDNKKWTSLFLPFPERIEDIEYPKDLDFVFVDGHNLSRSNCVNFMFGKCKLIAAHDYEKKRFYHWKNIVVPSDYRKIVYTENLKETVLFVHTSLL